MSLTKTTWKCWREASHIVTTTRFGWPQCSTCNAAPAYHERWDYVPVRFWLTIYVPAPGSFVESTVLQGSAIVGYEEAGRASIYFEGHKFNREQYANAQSAWEDGLVHASGRMVTAYPTIACLAPQAGDLIAIGRYWPRQKLTEVTNQDALDAWLGG